MSGTETAQIQSDTKENENVQMNQVPEKPKKDVEKEQEAKLRARYPGLKGPGSNAFLQKRLSRGQKYFDSGDYNMAKAKMSCGPIVKPVIPAQKLLLQTSTGEAIPTPEAIPHKHKHMVQSKLIEAEHLTPS